MRDVWLVGAEGTIGGAIQTHLNHHVTWVQLFDVRVNVEQIKLELGGFDPQVLVYNAGRHYLNWSEVADPAEVLDVYDVNVVGLLRCIQAAPTLKKVVVIGSDAARRPMRTSLAYNASKAALEAVVKVIARERAADGFIINVVAPGLVAPSAMTDDVYVRTMELRPALDLESYMMEQIPMGRAGSPNEVAKLVAWLVDHAPSYINGTVIDINGGR